jgi:cellulose synthase/poly-beta-1,6-N-acetylglucosamine synthase-like glycosyltransferase
MAMSAATRRVKNWPIRLAGFALILGAIWFGPWLIMSVNVAALWLAIPFAGANLLIIIATLVTFINNWRRSVPAIHFVSEGDEPDVAVIIPTAGEPGSMVARTAESVLQQKWPNDKITLVISDDAHSAEIESVVVGLQRAYRDAVVLYHEPPMRGSAERRGVAKAGNLNSALDMIVNRYPHIEFIETRDADDEVGDWAFLRHCVGQLMSDMGAAYVQTIKEARVSEGDPFANLNVVFYRGTMLARHAANAVIPCGSGLVWHTSALSAIGGFPIWNLVEDLQSGVEALRRGWRGIYLPIVGAIGQTAPEDIPNVYKQSGTWALDTMRLFFWGNFRGLNLRQRLHFIELGLFYMQSFTVVTILITLAISLSFQVYPLTTTNLDYAMHFWPFALSIEVFLATLNDGQRYETLLRQREMWMGLAPVYIKACIVALISGPHRKPTYRVTRKTNRFTWYWRETLPQMLLFGLIAGSMIYGLLTTPILTSFDFGSAYWALFYGVFLAGFIRKGWYGTHRRRTSDRTNPASQEETAGAGRAATR